ncbi:MAG TPA: SLAP domain-containing protein [Candidatus Bathyarchaeia archaeon]|nr:SLAP domain-containing protein [Candidatus Bathyarchaeia archaeon]
MSWLLENWFGTQESLEQVRGEIREHLQKESYLGVSGLDHPEQSANRVESKELSVILHGPWESKLEDMEEELLEYIHEQFPPVVRDEVGILPFFTNVTPDGYLVLAFLRNACNRDILLQKLPLVLTTPDGEVVARKTFDMMPFGILGKFVSRPSEFMFRWEEFTRVPEQEVPLTLSYEGKPKKRELTPEKYTDTNGLSEQELGKYMEHAEDKIEAIPGQVDLQVLDIAAGDEGGFKIVVLFRNGLGQRLEFTEVPIRIHDKQGREVARVRYELSNLRVDPQSSRVWTFYVPEESIKLKQVSPEDCVAYIPQPQQSKDDDTKKGLMQ